MEKTLFSCDHSGIDICSDRNLFDLENADDATLLHEDPINSGIFSDRLSSSLLKLGLGFVPSKSKTLLQDWIGPMSRLPAARKNNCLRWIDLVTRVVVPLSYFR